MKILISGYYGFGNVGDEAVLESILRGFRERLPEVELTVLSAAPVLTEELDQVRSIHRYSFFKILREMWRTDVLVSGGGTLFQDVTSTRSFLYYTGIILLAKILRKKVMVFAQGFGPLRKKVNRNIACFVLDQVDLITLRDEDSFDMLKAIGVTKPPMQVTGDPTALLDLPGHMEGRKILSLEGVPLDRSLLGVSVRSFPHRPDIEKKVFSVLAKALDNLAEKYKYRIVFTLFQCPEDMREASKVIALMKESPGVIFRICRPDEMLAVIANFDFLIGMRLHALIFAALSGVPLCGISYDPKVASFLKTVDQPCIDPEQIDNLENILGDLLLRKERLLETRKKLYQKAALNFELFFDRFGEKVAK